MKSDVDGKPQRLRQITSHVFALDSIDSITLVGGVASEEERDRMARVVAALQPERRLVNRLEVDPELRTEVSLSIMETQADEEELSSDDSDSPYFPATDPVITMVDGDVAILGGFSPTSMDCQDVAISADGQVGDEALADAVRLELREDAATTDLPIIVHVRDGIVYLHGTVPDLVDSDNAAEVASRMPGVDEIIDLLTVTAMESHSAGYGKV